MGFSKPWTHQYARELHWAFLTKTMSWKYEEEYRLIEINLDKQEIPENRIRHYPIEALTAVYFGVNTPKKDRMRIYLILTNKNLGIQFFESSLNGTNSIEFFSWEYQED